VTTTLPSKSPPLLVGNVLNQTTICDVTEDRLAALQIRDYFPADYCHLIAQRLMRSELFGYYVNAKDIGWVGMSYFETTKSPDLWRLYYENATRWIQGIRDLCWPHPCPMDFLRVHLQERWPVGATLETVDGQPMFVGLARVFGNSAGALPHQYVLARDSSSECERARTLKAQLAVNAFSFYPAPQGGELEIWLRKPTSEEFEAIRILGSYGADQGPDRRCGRGSHPSNRRLHLVQCHQPPRGSARK
jgi:hypothetical protein